MKATFHHQPPRNQHSRAGVRGSLLVGVGVALIVLLAIFLPRPAKELSGDAGTAGAPAAREHTSPPTARRWSASRRLSEIPPGLTAEEVVSNKVSQFARNRREVLHKMAEHFKVKVPPTFGQFLDAVEAGRWQDVHDQFEALNKHRKESGWDEDTATLWPVIMETYGVAETAHDWPAQPLLDYGQAVLGSLRPDMVYVGGTDPGRFIPTLLNETSDGERRVVLTQNALADSTYLQYVRFLYGDRLSTLTADDSQSAFKNYSSDARARAEHDQQFPDEPRQLRPGEAVQVSDDRVQISGQVAVMAINERLFQTLMDKNPDVSFAIEQSFPFKSMYADATPLGPIMELRVKDPQNALTAERAAAAVDYWNSSSQQLLAGLAANDSPDVRKTYAKMAAEQASLLLARSYPAQAEENLRLADQICPSSPEVVFNYVNLLVNQNRKQEAVPVLENAIRAAPDNPQFSQLLEQLQRAKRN